MARNRDEFTQKTKQVLANRVGVKCSNPDCRKPTSGANDDPSVATNVGVAAHICAASAGGPRYDSKMTPEERTSVSNGIWLCQTCSKLIDANPLRYTKEVLHEWKESAEKRSKLELEINLLNNREKETFECVTEELSNRWFPKGGKRTTSALWGYKELDKRCKLTAGSIVLLAGYSDRDNSTFAQNIILRNTKAQNKVIYFCMKEASDTAAMKMLSAESYVRFENIRTGVLTDEEWQCIAYAARELHGSELLIENYDNRCTMFERVLEAVKCGNADMVVVDDFSALGLDEKTLDPFMYQLRSATGESATSVLLLLDIQNKPKRMDTRPLLSDSQINRIHKFCDVVQFLFFDEDGYFSEDSYSVEMEVIVAKSYTSGNAFRCKVCRHSPYFSIVEIEEGELEKSNSLDKYPGLLVGLEEFVKEIESI